MRWLGSFGGDAQPPQFGVPPGPRAVPEPKARPLAPQLFMRGNVLEGKLADGLPASRDDVPGPPRMKEFCPIRHAHDVFGVVGVEQVRAQRRDTARSPKLGECTLLGRLSSLSFCKPIANHSNH